MDLLRSLPLGLYLEQPVTWLHRLDPRVKFAWLMTFLTAPILAHLSWRIGLSAVLIGLTFWAAIPRRVWRQQMGWLLAFCLLLLAITAIAPDGLGIDHQPRRPLPQTQQETTTPTPIPEVGEPVAPPTHYRYVVANLGHLEVTRRSLDLGIRLSTLIFTLVYSTNLFLLTTAPEEVTAGLEDLMRPLRWFHWPVTEIALTLTLALRFIPLVMEEVQNLARAIQTRAIHWKKLGWRGTIQIWMMVAERLLENLLLRAEQMAGAMVARGFTTPNEYQVVWHDLHLRRWDWAALVVLLFLWGGRLIWGWE